MRKGLAVAAALLALGACAQEDGEGSMQQLEEAAVQSDAPPDTTGPGPQMGVGAGFDTAQGTMGGVGADTTRRP